MSFALAVALSLAATPVVAAASLSAFQWENRVLVIFAEPDSPHYAEQQRLLGEAKPGLAERDMLVLAVSEAGVDPLFGQPGALDPDALREKLDHSGTAFEAVLVGKDGGVKHRQDTPIASDELFAIIDAMPMRASEMDRNR